MKKVAILIGSKTDKDIMISAEPYYDYFGIQWELMILSAHRNPDKVGEFARNARSEGYGCLVAGAGMAAHLAGMLKAYSTLPVIGVPMPGGISSGLDALLSTVPFEHQKHRFFHLLPILQ